MSAIPGSSKRILIVEDEIDMAQIMSERLTLMGFEVVTVGDAMGGVKKTYEFEPHLILLDLMMPGGGGLYFLERIKRSSHATQIPIIVLTGIHDEDYKKKVLEVGVHAYLEKPYSVENLLMEITRVFGVYLHEGQ